jgi:parvulin-like peptidyl-prolyl isomerase
MHQIKANKIISGLIYLIVFLFIIVKSAQAVDVVNGDKIVAVVNDMVITQSEVQDYVNFAYVQLAARLEEKKLNEEISRVAKDALVRLVEDKLILQEALKQGIKIEEKFIDDRLSDMKEGFKSEEDFQKTLQTQHISIGDLKKSIRDQELMRAIVDKEIKSKIYVSPQEITTFYNEHPEEFNLNEGRLVSFLFCDNQKEAESILAQIKQGKDFAIFFQSDNSRERNKEIRKGKLEPDAEKQLFAVPVGAISPAVKINNKYYIFKVLKILPQEKLSLTQAQDSAYVSIFDEKMTQELTDWLDKLKDKAYIVIK